MALDIGIAYNNDKRIKSGIKYAIYAATTNGHCAVLKENLISYCMELLGVTKEEIEEELINLKATNDIVIEQRNENENWVYLYSFYKAEENISNRIKILSNSLNMKKINGLDKKIKNIEKETNIELSDKQKKQYMM